MVPPREELLQNIVQRLMSIMRHIRHPAPPPGEVLLSPPLANLLFTIAHKKDGIAAKELADITGVTPGAITQFINILVTKGLVEREGDPSDRRVVRLKVTTLAKEQADKFRQEHLASFAQIFDILNDEEIQQLILLLDKIETTQTGKDKSNGEPDKTP